VFSAIDQDPRSDRNKGISGVQVLIISLHTTVIYVATLSPATSGSKLPQQSTDMSSDSKICNKKHYWPQQRRILDLRRTYHSGPCRYNSRPCWLQSLVEEARFASVKDKQREAPSWRNRKISHVLGYIAILL